MTKSYTSNFFKIYLWQTISVVLNLASMFIVTPQLAGQPAIYGIYMLCISLTIFLSYADLGFLSAGFKYASEKVAQKNQTEEIEITGFVLFILFIAIIPFFAALILFSYQPALLIKNIGNIEQIKIASQLLLILALSCPTVLGQRFLQLVYGVRLEEYVFQRIAILGNILKISSIFYFFSSAKYEIVGYYLFCQILALLCVVIPIFLIKKRYAYNFLLLLKSFRFSKTIFSRSKNLALASLYGTIAWILYYELDSMAISKFLGPVHLAFYAIGTTLLSFLRTIFGTIFGPFTARFNHYIGLKDTGGVKQIYLKSIRITLPITVFPIFTILLLLKPFIYCWVGSGFDQSIVLSAFLLSGYIFSSIQYPTSILMVAQERTKIINCLSFITVFSSWATIIILFSKFGVLSFAIGKFIALVSTGIAYTFFSKKYLGFSFYLYIRSIVLPLVPSLSFILVFLLFASQFLNLQKGKLHLFYVLLTGGFSVGGATFIYYFFAKDFKKIINQLLLKSISIINHFKPSIYKN